MVRLDLRKHVCERDPEHSFVFCSALLGILRLLCFSNTFNFLNNWVNDLNLLPHGKRLVKTNVCVKNMYLNSLALWDRCIGVCLLKICVVFFHTNFSGFLFQAVGLKTSRLDSTSLFQQSQNLDFLLFKAVFTLDFFLKLLSFVF